MMLTDSRLQAIKSAFQAHSGMQWSELHDNSSEIVLFGSWAINRETENSDIDLLCIDYPKRIKTPNVDLLAFPNKFLTSNTWLTSELAIHISQYGIWLKGEGLWKHNVRITDDTITKKEEQFLIRLIRLRCSLKNATRKIRIRELTKLRRDVQRLGYLKTGQSTPPGALLDDEWRTNTEVKGHVQALINSEIMGISAQNPKLFLELL